MDVFPSSSKLNDKVYAPNFWMPTTDTILRHLSYEYWNINFDSGEIFLCFNLPPELRKYVRDRMKKIKDKLENSPGAPPVSTYESWCRNLFGSGSPFSTIKIYYHAEEVIVGDHKELGNPL